MVLLFYDFKGQTKLSRQPLGELQSNITETCGGLPEIRVKVADSGCLQVDCETSEVTTQTDSSCVASDNKVCVVIRVIIQFLLRK